MPEKCHVHNCTQPVVAKGLCQTHYKRLQRHGDVEPTRPKDWGSREKHPAYGAWCNLRRYHADFLPDSWKNDFWAFVSDIPEKPERAQAFRPDKLKIWGRDNFYWKERREGPENRREYMQQWYQKSRAANPDYYADKDLQKLYGVTLDWYNQKFKEQNGVCAICQEPETAVIRGRTISMAVDHCHNTGSARGLLCTKCNQGLGMFRDKIDILESAVRYLRRSTDE
jgi:hypothetical protein